MRPIVGLHAWVALACMATATTALAQPSAEASARAAFDRGLAAETAGRDEEACTHFRESLSLQRELGPLLKVKGCDVREGKLVAARRGLRELIGRWVEPGQDLEALKAELTRVEARIAHVTVRLGTASIERVEIGPADRAQCNAFAADHVKTGCGRARCRGTSPSRRSGCRAAA